MITTLPPEKPAATSLFKRYLVEWNLIPDGAPVSTYASNLLPVLYNGEAAMLKLARHPEERSGALLMRWWNGAGAARVLAHRGNAVLLERATGVTSLAAMARHGLDSEASKIICSVAARLHAVNLPRPPQLVPLTRWFRDLEPVALRFGGVLRHSFVVSRELLAHPKDIVVLHGDLHHGNVLDAGSRGWLAIDPKGLLGERGFDFANIFCNPGEDVAIAPGRLAAQATVIADAAALDRHRLLQWVLAYAGLSAAWSLGVDYEDPQIALAVAALAAAELGLS